MGDGAGVAGYKTVRGDSTWKTGNITLVGGAGSVHATLNDNSDATYIRDNAGYDRWGGIDNAAVSLSATQRLKRIRSRIRAKATATDSGNYKVHLYRDSTASAYILDYYGLTLTVTTWTLPWYTTTAEGSEWTAYASTIRQGAGLEGFNGADSVRVYELYLDLDIRDPIVLGTPVITNTGSTRPTITWTSTPNVDGDSQKKYEIFVYPQSSYSAAGFSPGVPTASGGKPWAWTSGQVSSTSAVTAVVGSDLAYGTTYRVYMRLATDFNGADWWTAYGNDSGFTIAIPGGSTPQPPAPVLVRTVDDDKAKVLLDVTTALNVLSANQSSLETDTTGWAAGSSTTIARSTAQQAHRTASLSLTRTGTTGIASATTPTGTSGVRVVGGAQYTAVAYFRTAVTARTCTVTIKWYNSAGTSAGSDSVSAGVSDSSANFNAKANVTATAPATAVYAAIEVAVAAAVVSEVHYVDQIGLAPGSSSTWTLGGYLSTATTTLDLQFQEVLGPNYLPANIADGGDTTGGTTTGFYPRTAADLLDSFGGSSLLGDECIRWGPSAAGSILDLGFLSTSPDYTTAPLVAPGKAMVATAWVRAETGTFQTTLGFGTHNAAGSVDARSDGSPLTASTTWQKITSGVVTVGDTALFGYLSFLNTGSTTTGRLLIDKVQLEVASTPTGWVQGTGDRSEDDWAATRYGQLLATSLPVEQRLFFHDYEVKRGKGVRIYRLRISTMDLDGTTAIATSYLYTAAYQTPVAGIWWLKDPLEPGLNWSTYWVLDSLTERIPEDVEAVHPLGREFPISVGSWISSGADGTLQIQTSGGSDWDALARLLRRQSALLLQSPAGLNKYVRILDRSWDRKGPGAALRRVVSVGYQEEAAP